MRLNKREKKNKLCTLDNKKSDVAFMTQKPIATDSIIFEDPMIMGDQSRPFLNALRPIVLVYELCNRCVEVLEPANPAPFASRPAALRFSAATSRRNHETAIGTLEKKKKHYARSKLVNRVLLLDKRQFSTRDN